MFLLLALTFVLLGIVWMSHRRLERRVDALEERVEALRTAAPQEIADVPDAALVADAAEPARPEPARPEPTMPEEARPDEVRPEAGEPRRPETFAGLFERLVGGRLLIWVGGLALAVAGVFLVRFTIEIGLVTPPVRMIMAGLFGLLLIGAGEVARGRGGGDQRIAQALAGAGIFILYAAAYGALTLYGLIPVGTASALMGAITAAALALALRHGVPTAAMGLAGGFVTPLLVGDPDAGAVPLLVYLALLNGALFALAWRRGWTWLAAAAIVLTFLWTGTLLLGSAADALAAGVFLLLFAVAASLVRPVEGRALPLVQPAAIALVQLALLVARADIGLPAWALFGALAGASLLLASRPEYRLLPTAALGLALLVLAARSGLGPDPWLPIAAAVTTGMFAGFAAWRLGRRGADANLAAGLACAALVGPALILRIGEQALLPRPLWVLTFAVLAAAAALLAWTRRGDGEARLPLISLSAAAAVLAMAAAHDLVPEPWLASAWLGVAVAAAAWSRLGRGLAAVALAVAASALLLAFTQLAPLWLAVIGSFAGIPVLSPSLPPPLDGLRLLLVPAALLMLVRHWARDAEARAARALGLLAAGAGLFGLYLLFKHMWSLSDARDFVARGFAERMLITQALFALGWAVSGRFGRVRAPQLAAVFTAAAAARLVWFDLLAHNPTFMDQWVGPLPALNLLLPAYLGAAAWLAAARARGGPLASLWFWLSLVALVTATMLLVRQGFQGPILARADLPRAEFYGYSLAGLLLSMALLWAGVRRRDAPVRVAGLALLTATVCKVFLVDAAALEGLLRILSFLGLGVALIGVGKLYATMLKVEQGNNPA